MSLTLVRSYFRTRMNSLNYKEWKDGFNIENIPSSLLNGSYHILCGSIDVNETGPKHISFDYPIILRLFLKGFRKPADAIDSGIEKGENIIKDIVSVTNRTSISCIKNVLCNNIEIIELSDTNDNSIIVEMNYTIKIIIELS